MTRPTATPSPAAPTLPRVVSAADWQAAREALLVKEKAATRTLDALAAERRRLPHVAFAGDYLHARDVSFALVSPAPLERLLAYRERMGWTLPWYSLTVRSRFNADCGVDTGFGLSVFIRDGDAVRRSYFTSGRGAEALGSTWTFLDLTPLGRQEQWEDSPSGYPQSAPYEWWRRHDEY